MAKRPSRRGFGSLRRLPSGRYQATYSGLDAKRHTAPGTFDAKEDAEAWLNARRREVQGGDWQPPTAAPRPVKFEEFAAAWVARRQLKPKTRADYRSFLRRNILPTFGSMPLKAITFEVVDEWYAALGTDTPTQNARVYGLLRTILKDAVDRGAIPLNPCNIRGAGNSKRARDINVATPDELAALIQAMPDRFRVMVLLAAWCGLRFGEVTALERRDIDLVRGVVHVRRGVTRVTGEVMGLLHG